MADDLRAAMQRLVDAWKQELRDDYNSRDPIDRYVRAIIASMVQQVEERLTWTKALLPAAREARAIGSVSTVNDGENSK